MTELVVPTEVAPTAELPTEDIKALNRETLAPTPADSLTRRLAKAHDAQLFTDQMNQERMEIVGKLLPAASGSTAV